MPGVSLDWLKERNWFHPCKASERWAQRDCCWAKGQTIFFQCVSVLRSCCLFILEDQIRYFGHVLNFKWFWGKLPVIIYLFEAMSHPWTVDYCFLSEQELWVVNECLLKEYMEYIGACVNTGRTMLVIESSFCLGLCCYSFCSCYIHVTGPLLLIPICRKILPILSFLPRVLPST